MFRMRFSCLALLLIILTQTVSAQTFFPVPGPLLEKEVALEQATECFVYFENPGGDTLRLRWKNIAKSHPAEWTLDLCDFGLCYVGIPASGRMNPASGAERPYLKLIVQPGSTPGSGWVGFRVWEDGNPANGVDVFFSLHTPGFTAAPEVEHPAVRVFPNPATSVLILENPHASSIPAWLSDVSGSILWAGNLAAGQRELLDLSAWPAGLFFLQTGNKVIVVQRAQ